MPVKFWGSSWSARTEMGILGWIIVGGIAGWLASLIMAREGQGCFLNIVVGIVGAFIGGIIMNVIGKVGVTGFNFRSLLVAVVGAVILLGFVRLVGGGRGKRRFKNL